MTPDDVNEVEETTEPAGEEVAAPTEPTSSPEEPEYEPPAWLNTDPETFGSTAERQPRREEQRPYYPPQPPAPRETSKPPRFTGDDVLEKGSAAVEDFIAYHTSELRQQNEMLAAALLDLRSRFESRGSEPHPAFVQRAYRDAMRSVDATMRDLSKDQAFKNQAVRQNFEAFIQGVREDAYTRAKRGDFGGIDALADREFVETAFEYAKRRAKWKPTAPVAPAAGVMLPKSSGQAESASVEIDPEAAQYLRSRGLSPTFEELKKSRKGGGA